jgi:hypothetical protein
MLVNATKRAITTKALIDHIKNNELEPSSSPPVLPTETSPVKLKQPRPSKLLPGQQFHMDMGFVRGTQYSHRGEDGNLITSVDGFNSYLVIVDRSTRFTWFFSVKKQVTTHKNYYRFSPTSWFKSSSTEIHQNR